MDIVKFIAKKRCRFFSSMTSVVNVANQLHILSNDKANELNKRNLAEWVDAMEHLGYEFKGKYQCFHDFMEEELK